MLAKPNNAKKSASTIGKSLFVAVVLHLLIVFKLTEKIQKGVVAANVTTTGNQGPVSRKSR